MVFAAFFVVSLVGVGEDVGLVFVVDGVVVSGL